MTGLQNKTVVLTEEAKIFFGRYKDQLNNHQGIVGEQLSNGWYVVSWFNESGVKKENTYLEEHLEVVKVDLEGLL